MKRCVARIILALVPVVLTGCVAPSDGVEPAEQSRAGAPAVPVASAQPTALAPTAAPTATRPASVAVPEGCRPAEPIPIPAWYIPYESMWGHGDDPPLVRPTDEERPDASAIEGGGLQRSMPEPSGGLRLLAIHERGDPARARAVYHRDTVSIERTYGDFLRVGGVIVDQRPTQGHTASRRAEDALDGLPPGREPRFVLLAVGRYEAFLNHGDEIYPGVRPVLLAWSDGVTDWEMRAATGVVDSTVLVDMARSMYCP